MQGTKFYRPARAYAPRLPGGDMVIASPPVVQPTPSGAASWIQYLLPVVGSLGSFIFIFAFHTNLLFMIAMGAVAFGSIGVGIMVGVLQRRMQKKQRKLERIIYTDYLTQWHTQLRSVAEMQQQVSTRLYPDPAALVSNVSQRKYLWERRPEDGDFLHVRTGVGPKPLCCDVRLDLGNSPMVKFVPDLRAQAEALVATYHHLDDMPIAIPLRNLGSLVITGNRSLTRALLRAMLCQIVALHSPEDVRCMVYFQPQAARDWNWLRWLPHVRRLRQVKAEKKNVPESFCLLADNVDDLRDLLINQIRPELERRRKLREDKKEIAAELMRPHLIIVLDGFTPHGVLAQLPELDELFRDAATLGITMICLADDKTQEPSRISARITVSSVGWLAFEENMFGGRRIESVTPDAADVETCEQIARSLAPLTLAEKGAHQDFSQDVRLLDLLSIATADAIQTEEVWQPHSRQSLLQVPIGRRADGKALILDLKEAADRGMGPHGLVVGATGSGKSELLRTLVTSLAITHDPSMVNFILVDFKGGASFADFAALPHVAGIITNLQSDASLVDRAYFSLLGEQQRRQRMLHEAGNLDNIKQYQARWQMDPSMEPMPHLLIIVDEFAELIANRPDFLDLFVTTGRVGRSLGLHMLLASQRIDEGRIRGLEGHLRYRICLRTFSAPESSAVLGSSDAYYLPSSPGVGYFKVDADIYDLFKTALISIPYVPAAQHTTPATLIRKFTFTGKLVKYQPAAHTSAMLPAPDEMDGNDLHTEMDVVITRLAGAQLSGNQKRAHQVWLLPLGKMLPLDELLRTYQKEELDGSGWQNSPPFGTLRIPIALLDNPLQQAQEPLLLDFSGAGGHLAIVGAPQSGKSTLLRTLVTSFIVTHSPRDVQLYGIDLGGGLLRVLENAPHVGTICSRTERDKIRRVIRQMRTIIDERAFLFREQGIDSMATYRIRRQAGELSDAPFGDVFLIIDNFAQMQQDFDQLVDDINDLVVTGLTYGVHVILAANRWAEIRPKVRDNIGTRLELRMNDPVESEVGKAAAAAIPVGVPGRGLTREKLQFQTALPYIRDRAERSEFQDMPLQQVLESMIQRTRRAWKAAPAPPIRMLPSLIRWEELPSGRDQPSGVPVGLEEFRLDPLYIDLIAAGPHFMVLGDMECGKTNLLRTLLRGLEQRYTEKQVAFAIVDYRKTLLDFAASKHLLAYAHSSITLKECVDSFRNDLEKRISASSNIPLEQLRHQQRWDGCHYFLCVDDYDSIVTTTGNPLAPLAEFLLAGRDIGFHLIITRRVGGVGRAGFEPVFQRLREMGSAGLVMSGDPQEGQVLGTQRAGLLPPGRGYLVRRNHPSTLVQIAFAEPVEVT